MSESTKLESAAQSIYEHWEFGSWAPGKKPAWVPGGNSTMQSLAREFARKALYESVEPIKPYTLWERVKIFSTIALVLSVVYAVFWLILCYTHLEWFNPLATEPGRLLFGLYVAIAALTAAIVSPSDDEEETK